MFKIMFSDADLIGVPFRVVVSPRNIKQHIVEIVSRDKKFSANAPMETAVEELMKILSGDFPGVINSFGRI